MFQNGFLSAVPFILCYIFGVGGSFVTDWLRYHRILPTGEVRKVFSTAGELGESLPSTDSRTFLVINSKLKVHLVMCTKIRFRDVYRTILQSKKLFSCSGNIVKI